MSDILAETPDRFLLLPVRDERAWAFYQEAVACFWTAQELDLTHDRYGELQDGERTLLNNVLAFFAAADGIVGENLCKQVCADMRVGATTLDGSIEIAPLECRAARVAVVAAVERHRLRRCADGRLVTRRVGLQCDADTACVVKRRIIERC